MTTTPLTCYAQTMPGVEKIAWLEIRDRFPDAKFSEFLFAKEQNGVVLFDYDGPLHKLLELRTAEDVFLKALSVDKLSRDWRDLRLITRLIQESDSFGQIATTLLRFHRLASPVTYRVISRQYGKFQYRRKDFEEAVIKGVNERYRGRWRHVEDDAEVEIWANLFGSRLLCGLRLSDRTMRHRHDKAVELPASLRPSVAAAMILLTNPQADDVFLDPMCGSGTLLIERTFAAPYRHILGGDISPARVQAARKNLDVQEGTTLIGLWNTAVLPIATGSVDKVATNPPFGKQVGSRKETLQLYPQLFAEIARVLKPNGRAIVLSSEYDLVKEVVRGQPELEILTGYSIATLGQWARIYVINRRPE